MAQVTTGLRAVLNFPKIYSLNQGIIGASRFRKEIVDQYIRPQNQMKILDLGCGTGEVLDYLPRRIVYLGLDLSEEYIAEAQQRRGDRGTFRAGRAEEAEWLASQQFDLVLAIGVLHHLGDAEAEAMMAISRSALNAGGRMVTVDPCLHEQQSSSARFLIGKDRGQNVRTEQGYRNLARPYFSTSKSTVRHDLLRIPYTHCILECTGRIVGLTGGGQG